MAVPQDVTIVCKSVEEKNAQGQGIVKVRAGLQLWLRGQVLAQQALVPPWSLQPCCACRHGLWDSVAAPSQFSGGSCRRPPAC